MEDATYKLRRLDRRELQVLFSICQGSTPSLIAAQLAIEKATVRATLLHIFQKLELKQLSDTEARFGVLKDVYCVALAGIAVEPPLQSPAPEPEPAPIDDPDLALAVDDAILALDRHRGLQNWRPQAFIQVVDEPAPLPAAWPALAPRRQPRSVPWWWIALALVMGAAVMYSFFPRLVNVPLPQTQIVMITNTPMATLLAQATTQPEASMPGITLSPIVAGTLVAAGSATAAATPRLTATPGATGLTAASLTPAATGLFVPIASTTPSGPSVPTFTPMGSGASGPSGAAYQSNFQSGQLDPEWTVVRGTPVFDGGVLKSMNGDQLILQSVPNYMNFDLEFSCAQNGPTNGLEFLLPNSVVFYVDAANARLWALMGGGTKELWSGSGAGAAASVKLVVRDGAYQVYLNGSARSPVVTYLGTSTGRLTLTMYAQSISSITITPTQ